MDIKYFDNIEDMSNKASEYIHNLYNKIIKEKGYLSLVLSGGKTPIRLYQILAESKELNWQNIYLFWGDERFVPYDNSESNYFSAFRNLINYIDIPDQNIFQINIQSSSIAMARQYDLEIKNFFKKWNSDKLTLPAFDIVLLGLGADGHIASLFPETKNINETNYWVINTRAPDIFPIKERISLSLPVINSARNILMLVSGRNKKNVVNAILNGDKKTNIQPHD